VKRPEGSVICTIAAVREILSARRDLATKRHSHEAQIPGIAPT